MRKTSRTHRIVIVALSASLALPIAPVFGQAAPVVVAPPSPVSAPPAATPPPPVAAAPPPAARPAPPPAPVARAEPARAARETRSATRAARPAPRARVAAPEAAPAPVATPAPAPARTAEAPLAAPPPALSEAPTAATGTATPRGSALPWLIAGLALLAGLIAFALLRRRRSRDEVYEDHVAEQPAHVEEPVAATAPAYQPPIVQPAIVAPLPSFRRDQPAAASEATEIAVESDVEEVNEVETTAADIEALGAADTTHRNRPWLEMLMRPIRAGANGEDTVVEFSLTVGNTGGVPAEDVRISAWMLGTQGLEAEGFLIEPPAGTTLSQTRIEAGDGATVEATVSMPREAFDRAMLPIVVTDARYRLPDGGEGRTSACFAVGLPVGEELVPFPANAASGLNEGVEARVHCDVEHI